MFSNHLRLLKRKTHTSNFITTGETKFRRRFGMKSSLIKEISIGDKVDIWGEWTDEGKTILEARLIRNIKIFKI